MATADLQLVQQAVGLACPPGGDAQHLLFIFFFWGGGGGELGCRDSRGGGQGQRYGGAVTGALAQWCRRAVTAGSPSPLNCPPHTHTHKPGRSRPQSRLCRVKGGSDGQRPRLTGARQGMPPPTHQPTQHTHTHTHNPPLQQQTHTRTRSSRPLTPPEDRKKVKHHDHRNLRGGGGDDVCGTGPGHARQLHGPSGRLHGEKPPPSPLPP